MRMKLRKMPPARLIEQMAAHQMPAAHVLGLRHGFPCRCPCTEGSGYGTGQAARRVCRTGNVALQVDARFRLAGVAGAEWRKAAPACRGASDGYRPPPYRRFSTMRPRYMTPTRFADVADDVQIVRDKQIRKPQLILKAHQQIQHLRLKWKTSSAETGSSATTKRGRVMSARAMAMR